MSEIEQIRARYKDWLMSPQIAQDYSGAFNALDVRKLLEALDAKHAPVEVYVMYYFNPHDDWADHRMSEVYVFETFEDAKRTPEHKMQSTNWREISPWRWQLGHYWVEKQTINYAIR